MPLMVEQVRGTGVGGTSMHWKRVAQRKLRQVLALLDEGDAAELGRAFELVDDAGAAIDQLLQRQEVSDG